MQKFLFLVLLFTWSTRKYKIKEKELVWYQSVPVCPSLVVDGNYKQALEREREPVGSAEPITSLSWETFGFELGSRYRSPVLVPVRVRTSPLMGLFFISLLVLVQILKMESDVDGFGLSVWDPKADPTDENRSSADEFWGDLRRAGKIDRIENISSVLCFAFPLFFILFCSLCFINIYLFFIQ